MAKPRLRRVVPRLREHGDRGAGGKRAWLVAVSLAVVIVGGVAGLVLLGLGSSGSQGGGPGATLVAYQGEALLGGSRVAMPEVIGRGKPVILNFFAGSCPPCRAEMPGFEAAWQRHRDEVLLLGVDIGPYLALGSHEDARRLLRDLQITYPAAYAEQNIVAAYNVVGMPTTIFYTPDGREVGRNTGVLSEGQLESAIRQLLALSPPSS